MARRPRKAGVSLVEMIVVLAVISLLATLAAPPLSRMRESAALQNGRAAVTSALSVARTAGTQWGRTSILRIDTATNRLRIVVDTGSAAGGVDTLVVRRYFLGADQGVALSSNRTEICFNSRGVATTAAACPSSGARIVLSVGARRDTIVVNSAGRVIP